MSWAAIGKDAMCLTAATGCPVRMATNALPTGLRLNKKFIPIPTRGGHFQKFWIDHWLGTYAFLIMTAGLIHFASTGRPLPFNRYSPIAKDKWGPLPFGYNSEFAAPDLPLEGRGGTRITADLAGQMDTAFRVLDPAGFTSARQSVPLRAFKNQGDAETYYGEPIDEIGPGGVFSRTSHFAQDMFSPIGPGAAGASILGQTSQRAEPFVSVGEEKLGIKGQLLQATGLNLRGETIDAGLKRRYPYFDQLTPEGQERLRKDLIEKVYGPPTRRDKERFQKEIWELFPPTEAERRTFKDKLDKEFGGGGRFAPGSGAPLRDFQDILNR